MYPLHKPTNPFHKRKANHPKQTTDKKTFRPTPKLKQTKPSLRAIEPCLNQTNPNKLYKLASVPYVAYELPNLA
jgi:hypothetical protein